MKELSNPIIINTWRLHYTNFIRFAVQHQFTFDTFLYLSYKVYGWRYPSCIYFLTNQITSKICTQYRCDEKKKSADLHQPLKQKKISPEHMFHQSFFVVISPRDIRHSKVPSTFFFKRCHHYQVKPIMPARNQQSVKYTHTYKYCGTYVPT